jgi:hypothetical protein
MALTKEQEALEKERQSQLFKEYQLSPDYQSRLLERLKLNDAGDRSAQARTYLWHLCARPDNPVEGAKFFINTFGWTFDPRPERKPGHLAFITFPFQDEIIKQFIDHVDNGRDWFIEKSRDMGMSWLVFVWLPVWYWLFRDGVNFLLGSYKEDLVDDRTMDSLFGKLDYAVLSLPKWLLPARFNIDKHRTHMRMTSPATGNVITGDTMNPNFGRGARKTAILFDELGSWDWAKDAWDGAADSTSCRVANSTPKGFNFYALLRESGIDVSRYHWTDHPLKDNQWYAYEQNRRNDEAAIAQELDISYTKSREGRVYPEWNELNVTPGLFPYDPNLPLYVGWDFGKTDDTAIIWSQEGHDGALRIVDTYRKTGKNIDFFVPFVTGIISSDLAEKHMYTPEELVIIGEHKNWAKGTHYGDPAGRFQNQVSDETVVSVLRNHGIVMNFKDAWKEHQLRKRATKDLIQRGVFLNENPRNTYFNICIINAAYPKVKHEGMETIRSDKPKHDSTSHYRSALEYLALGLTERGQRRGVPYDKFKKRATEVAGIRPRRVTGY